MSIIYWKVNPVYPVLEFPAGILISKGRAIRSGLTKVKEGLVLIQDADLEYNPRDYKKLLKPFRLFSPSLLWI